MLFAFSSCEEDTANRAYDGESYAYFLDDFLSLQGSEPYTDHQIKVGTLTPVGSNVDLRATAVGGDAVEGTDYELLNNGVAQIAAGSNEGFFTIRVYGAGLDLTVPKEVKLKLNSSSLPTTNYNQEQSLFLTYGCPSDLEGEYTYSTVNFGVPGSSQQAGPITGNVTLTQTDSGVYSISDAAFGVYIALWNAPDNVPAIGVNLVDLCGKLSFSGKNQYGDTWTISNVVVSGANLTFDWITSYSEYGTTTLTRTDGTNWPTNLN